MARILVLLVATLEVAHADDATPITLAQALAAAERAPAAQIGGHDVIAAQANIDAASAWPNPERISMRTSWLALTLVLACRHAPEADEDDKPAPAAVTCRAVVAGAIDDLVDVAGVIAPPPKRAMRGAGSVTDRACQNVP